jgi:ABC-2 type transport system permease protein
MRESSDLLATVCLWNPFTHAVDAIRFAFYGQVNTVSLLIVVACTLVFFLAASWSYDPARRFRAARTASA